MIEQLFKPRGWFEENQAKLLGHQDGVQDLLRLTYHSARKSTLPVEWGRYFPILAQCIRLKKFSYPQVSGKVTQDVRMKYSVKQVVEETCREMRSTKISRNVNDENVEYEDDSNYMKLLKKHEKRALQILLDMRSTISDLLLRITSWILYKLLPCFLSGVVTRTNHIEMLKLAADKSPNIPLIFLPLHRSHLDYILISFILLNNNIRSPIVAAGNNLRIPFFGSVLRGLGAFYIKRRIDPVVGKKDIIYRTVLQLYLQYALEAGHNLEFFIEGGRTRTGKPCMPKNGILSIIVKAFMDGTITDALLVPVSVNYEKLVDGNFVREQLGQRKQPETFKSAVFAIWKVLNSKCGLMRIDFNKPFSLRELVQSFNEIASEDGENKIYRPNSKQLQHNQSSSSLYGTDVVCEDHRTLVESISRHVVYDCAAATSVMTTNAIAFLLLTHFREGVYDHVLADELDKFRKELKGRRDLGFSGESSDIVAYGCYLLGENLVGQEIRGFRTYIRPNIKLPHVIELSYYSNSLSPHFALESVIIIAMENILKQEKVEVPEISKKKLKQLCLDYCNILRYEFIFNKPTQNIDDLLEENIENLRHKEIISIRENIDTHETTMLKRKFSNLEILEDDFEKEPIEVDTLIYFCQDKHVERRALVAVLAPVFCAYQSVGSSLDNLLGTYMLEVEFIKICIQDITQLVDKGIYHYAESISMEFVKNSMKLFEKLDILQISNEHGVRICSLTSFYNSSHNLKTFCNQLQIIVSGCN